jgi:hypothetical protein
MKLMICLLGLCLSGCCAKAEYGRIRITTEMVAASNLCLDHGGVNYYSVQVNEGVGTVGPIQGVYCVDEKYFRVPDYSSLISPK